MIRLELSYEDAARVEAGLRILAWAMDPEYTPIAANPSGAAHARRLAGQIEQQLADTHVAIAGDDRQEGR